MTEKINNTAPQKRETKADKVIALLKRKQDAVLGEIVQATDWLPHTARAAMTGLRRKGHMIERTKLDGASRHAITADTGSGT